MQSEGEKQRISWRLGPPVTSPLHPKVTRTYSVCGPSLTDKALLLAPCRDLSADVRSSPDGSAGNSDERKPTNVNRQINDDDDDDDDGDDGGQVAAAAVTLRGFCCGGSEMSVNGCDSRDNAVPPGWSHDATGTHQPCPQQEEDSSLRLSVTNGSLTEEGDAKSSPVASESRDELLQCETGTFALEDVLRHYWLLSDHDDDAQKVKLRREPVYSAAFDWLASRSPGTYLGSGSPETNVEVDDVGPSFPCERNEDEEEEEDAESIVTLSTISEEDSEEISSADASQQHRTATALFGGVSTKSPTFRNNNNNINDDDADILRGSEENFVGKFVGGFSGDDDDETSSENSERPEIRIPDGLESEAYERTYSSNAFETLVRTFSRYVSDVYPYSPAFISYQTSTGPEGQRKEGRQNIENPQDTYKEDGTQLVHDNRSKLQLVLPEKDRSMNSDDSAEPWYSANGSGNVSTVASPTSWYTMSDGFDAQSFETASENLDGGGSADVSGSTAFAKCTAFASYHDTDSAPDAKFRSSVTARVTAGDPIVAISQAAAKAATLAAVEVVRSCDRCPGNIEVALTANCSMASPQFDDFDNDNAQCISKTNVAKLEESVSVSTQRFNPTTESHAETQKLMTELVRSTDGEFSCGIAIPHTRNGDISTRKEFDAGSVTDGVQDFAENPDKCEVASAAVLDCAKIKNQRSKKDSAEVEIILSGIKISADGDNNFCQTSDVTVDSAVTDSTTKTNSLSADVQTANNASNCCCITHGTVKLENPSENPELELEKVEAGNKKPAPRSPSELLDGVKRMETSKPSHQMTRSLSHLLETDIDTLEHRRTEVSRNGSVSSSIRDCRSYTNLLSLQPESEISNDLCLLNSFAPSFGKEALEELLSDSSPVRYLTKKPSNLSSNSQTEGHYASVPNLQPGVDKGRVSSSGGEAEKRNGNTEHSYDGVLSVENNRSLNNWSAGRIKSNIASPQGTHNSSTIERYDCSPSLRRRSLSVLSTPSSDRYAVPGTTLGQGQASTRTPDSGRRSVRPVSSSFENLIDSLLGITAIMSMETAATHSRPLFASREAEIRKRGGYSSSENSSPASMQRRNLAARTLPSRREINGGNQGTPGAPLAALSDSSAETTPVHSVQAARKRVHFRKAKHIFRKCSFCIEGNDRKTTVSPTRNRTAAVVSRKDANGTAKSH